MAVLITGASGGLGPAVVDAFLRTGAEVFGVARRWDAAATSPTRFHPLRADLSTAEGAAEAVRQAGSVDVLVHVMGGFGGGQPVSLTEDAVWEQMLDINLRSAVRMFRAVLPGMQTLRRGRILAVGSLAANDPIPGFAAYSVSKAALVALVRSVAVENRAFNITANAVLPGTLDTAPNRTAMPNADRSRWVQPSAVADLLLWLASEAAAPVNGAAIPIG